MRAAARLAREALRAGAALNAGTASRGLACSAGGRLAGALRTAAAAPRAAAAAPPRAAAEAARGFACRTKFDAPPPKMVMIEYDPADVDSFIALADAVEDEFPDVQVEGNVAGVDPRKGAFEVTTEDGRVLFSKLKMRRDPRSQEVVASIRTLMPGVGAPVDGFGGCA